MSCIVTRSGQFATVPLHMHDTSLGRLLVIFTAGVKLLISCAKCAVTFLAFDHWQHPSTQLRFNIKTFAYKWIDSTYNRYWNLMGLLMGCLSRLEKTECACKLFKIKEPATAISLRLTGGAYTVYQQFRDDADLDKIQHSLYKASGMDTFVAWQQFVGWWLHPGETVDIYLVNLHKIKMSRCSRITRGCH